MYKALAIGSIGHSVDLAEAAPIAKKLGYEGIWLDVVKDSELGAERTKEILSENGLKAAGFGMPLEYRDTKEEFEESFAKLEPLVKYASEVGCKRSMTWIIPGSDKYDYDANFAIYRDRLKKAAELFGKYDILLGIEFVGPPGERKGKKYEFIHDLDGVLSLIEAIDEPNVGFVMDVWHWDMAGQTLEDYKKLGDQSKIACVHINDAPAGKAIEEQQDLVRELPGATGILKIEEFFNELKKMGFDGPVYPEPFVDALSEMSFEEAAKTAIDAVNKVWPK